MVALSFDIEEFDLPLEHGIDIQFERQIAISAEGAGKILDILNRHEVSATFFSTVRFAYHAPSVVGRLLTDGHEIASHGMQHTGFNSADLRESRLRLSEIAGKPVIGFRMPRMMKLQEAAIAEAGYLYDSSLNPTFIPGRYLNLRTPRRPFMKEGVLQIPTSVTPVVRFPMFWLSAHLLPQCIYRAMAGRILRHDGCFSTYFHPWEFYDLNTLNGYKIPAIIRLNSGQGMQQRLDRLIAGFKERGERFVTYSEIYNHFMQHNRTDGTPVTGS